MMITEFISLTGFEVTEEEYSIIENSYYDFDGNKIEFCKDWVKNGGIQRVAHARDRARVSELEIQLAEAQKEIDSLKEQLLDWQPCDCGTNLSQEKYKELEGSCATEVLTVDKAKELLYNEFGFAANKITIIDNVSTYEVNKHRQIRVADTYERKPLYMSTDYNYIRLKTSELKSLLVNDLVDENANNRLRLLRTFNKDSVENYLQIRRNFLDERQIKSDFLFFTKSGGENANINVDFELLRDKCCIKNNITLASIRNNCMTIFSNTIGNEELSALLFDVTIWRIKEMREQNLIITLPCTVGTMVYMILDVFSGNTKPERKILSGTIDNFKIGQDGVPLAEICIEGNGKFSTCIYGKDYYLTYEEAEKVMKGSFETYFCDVTAKTGQGMT